MIMDKYKHALKVSEGIKTTASYEMLDHLAGLNAFEIYNLTFRYARDSGKLDEFLITVLPGRVEDLTNG